MKKKITYELPCHRKAEDCEAPPKSRGLWKSLGAFLALVMLLMLAVPEAKADLGNPGHGDITRYNATNHKEGYIEFRVPFYTTQGNHTKANEGSYVMVGGHVILKFKSVSEPGTFKAEIESRTGEGRLCLSGDDTNFIDCTDDETIVISTKKHWGNEAYYFSVRFYPRSFEEYKVTTGFNSSGPGHDAESFKVPSLDPQTPDFTVDQAWDFGSDIGSYSLSTKITDNSGYIKGVQWDDSTIKNIAGLQSTYQYSSQNYNNEKKVKVEYYWVQSNATFKPLTRLMKTEFITIPAYHQAQNFAAVYSKITGKVTLSWNVNNANEANCITEDDFGIEASTDVNFTSPRTVKLVKFVAGEANYLIEDDVAELSGNSTMHYRIRRTYTKEKWKLYNIISVALETTDHAKITAAKAELDIAKELSLNKSHELGEIV